MIFETRAIPVRIQDKFHLGLPGAVRPTLLCGDSRWNNIPFMTKAEGVQWVADFNAKRHAKNLPELFLVG